MLHLHCNVKSSSIPKPQEWNGTIVDLSIDDSAPLSDENELAWVSGTAMLLCVLHDILSPADASAKAPGIVLVVVLLLRHKGESGCVACRSRFSSSSCRASGLPSMIRQDPKGVVPAFKSGARPG